MAVGLCHIGVKIVRLEMPSFVKHVVAAWAILDLIPPLRLRDEVDPLFERPRNGVPRRIWVS